MQITITAVKSRITKMPSLNEIDILIAESYVFCSGALRLLASRPAQLYFNCVLTECKWELLWANS